jgi:hypothetical protein
VIPLSRSNSVVAIAKSLISSQLERQQDQLERHQDEQATIDSRRRIFKHDVELDSIFSVPKVGLVLAITFVLKEYLGGACMEALTFLDRVATLPARLRLLPQLEILTFEYSHRVNLSICAKPCFPSSTYPSPWPTLWLQGLS